MPVRTSAVVAGGLALLAIIGIATIFGESLMAVVAPPAIEAPSSTAAAPAAGPPAGAKPLVQSGQSASPVVRDGGRTNNPHGNP